MSDLGSIAGMYLIVGFIVAGRSLSVGRIGTAGVMPSFLFQTLFWPLFLGRKS